MMTPKYLQQLAIPDTRSKWWLYLWILIMELHSHHPSGAQDFWDDS